MVRREDRGLRDYIFTKTITGWQQVAEFKDDPVGNFGGPLASQATRWWSAAPRGTPV